MNPPKKNLVSGPLEPEELISLDEVVRSLVRLAAGAGGVYPATIVASSAQIGRWVVEMAQRDPRPWEANGRRIMNVPVLDGGYRAALTFDYTGVQVPQEAAPC